MTSTTSYRTRQLSDSDSSSSDDDTDQPWKRQRKTRAREPPMAISSERPRPPRSVSSASNKRRRNNIWGEVVQEQVEEQVARDMTQFDMRRNKERDVESYSYRLDDLQRKSQPLGKPISFGDNPDSQNRKMPAALGDSNDDSWLVDDSVSRRGMKDRLGPRNDGDAEEEEGRMTFFSTMKAVTIKPDMHKKEVAGKIAYSLQEPHRDMVITVVDELGIKKTVAVWEHTCDIEKHGGMLVNTGHRRRTPGGVFFQLIKTDPDVTQEKKDIIFEMSRVQSKLDSKNKRKRRRKGRSRERGRRHEEGNEGKADSMDVETKPEEETNTGDLEVTHKQKTDLRDLEMKQENEMNIKQEGEANAMDLETKQDQDEVKGDADKKCDGGNGVVGGNGVTSGVEHGADEMEEREAKVEPDELEAGSERCRHAEDPDEDGDSGSSEEEEREQEEEADIGKAIERRLMEIKQEKQKSSEEGGMEEQENGGNGAVVETQNGGSCVGTVDQKRGGQDAEMEDGEVSD